MLAELGHDSLEAMISAGVPNSIRTLEPPDLPPAQSETEALESLRSFAGENQIWRTYIGQGYYNCITPPVIQRNLLENPGWYTCLLYTSPSPRDATLSRMPSSA